MLCKKGDYFDLKGQSGKIWERVSYTEVCHGITL